MINFNRKSAFFILFFGLMLGFINLKAQNQVPNHYQAIPLENLDRSINPKDNFYLYAVGNWIKTNPVPPSKSSWYSFNELYENNKKALHAILLEASNSHAPMGSNTQKIGDFFNSGLDSISRNHLGYEPIKPYLDEIEKINSPIQLIQVMSQFIRMGLGYSYRFGIDPDDKNSKIYLVNIGQGGLGLPDRDYYLKDNDRSKMIRSEYKKYIIKMFGLIGFSDSQAELASNQVFSLEKDLAINCSDRVKLRDPYANYHKISLNNLVKSYPDLDWMNQLNNLGLDPKLVDSVNVGQPQFYKGLDSLVIHMPMENWKNYLRWKLISSSAGALSSSFENESFAFNGTVLNGVKIMEKRWERLSGLLDRYLGEALGEEYVKKAFPPEAKERMKVLISNLRESFAERIKALDWMSDSTKIKALNKLNHIMVKIGYPDKWKDYSDLNIIPGNYFQNILNAKEFAFKFEISHYGKPVDKSEWGMTPPTVNAYYNSSFNEIVFPAGILQPPFFDFKADDAVNYGGIGSVIGHEMTHGFDDEGRLYDADGNLKSWWTDLDAVQFKKRAQRVVDQFNLFTVLDTVHVNGKLTEGENLADLGGTMISYQAFKKTEQGKSNIKIDGFTPDQRFFLGFAQVWRGNISPQAQALRIITDPHAPGNWRTNGPLSNNLAFYKAFDIKPGDKMYRTDSVRAKVW